MDVFFNDAPITDYDLCVNAKLPKIQLTASFFKEDKDEVLWDTLLNEGFIDSNNSLNITKTYAKVDGKWKSTTAILAAQCPCLNNVPLISLKITELKDICKKHDINCSNNKESVALRTAIQNTKGLVQYCEELIPVDTPYTDLKTIYSSIKSAMPEYIFFGSDKASFSDDCEISSLLKGLVQMVNKDAEVELAAYKCKIKSAIKEKLSKLWEEYVPQDIKEQHDINVNIDIDPKGSLFKYTLVDQNNISVNSFGNGCNKRLLLAFLEMSIANNPNTIIGVDELDSYLDSDGLDEVTERLTKDNDNGMLFVTVQDINRISSSSYKFSTIDTSDFKN